MPFTAIFGTGRDLTLLACVQRFRKTIFVDRCGWDLTIEGDREFDQFDAPNAVHLALYCDEMLCASFRATRTDRPYLAADVFPELAVVSPYPRRADAWEISRFGVLLSDQQADLARVNYALMFFFAQQVGASSLVALADLTYERFLRTLGIRTRRFGPPRVIGTDNRGRALRAIAGEIPLALQEPDRLAAFSPLLQDVRIDAADTFGPSRLSA